MPGDYIKCPRCELNYIKRGEEYCDVCKAELNKGNKLLFVDNFDEDDEVEDIDLCPRCHQNYIKPGAQYCESCLKEIECDEAEIDPEDNDSWKEYLDDDTDIEEENDEELRSLDKLAEEEGDELFDDEEEEYIESEPVEPDDFEIPDLDESDFEDYDEDEDEDDYDDEDDGDKRRKK